MAREVALDANVLVAWLDAADALASRDQELLERLKAEGAEPVLLDVTVSEAVSVLCRRAAQRKASPPDLGAALDVVRGWGERGAIRWVAAQSEEHFGAILDVVASTGGKLNFNDALLVVLQREGVIGELAPFDAGFDGVAGSVRVS